MKLSRSPNPPNRRRSIATTSVASVVVAASLVMGLTPAYAAGETAARTPERSIGHDEAAKTITMTDGELTMVLAYDGGASVTSLTLGEAELLEAGMYSTAELDASGVVLDNGDEILARAVVAAIDPKQALLNLVPPVALPPTFRDRIANIRARGVTAKINFAMDRPPVFRAFDPDPVPLRGRLVLAPDVDYLERAFDHTKYGEMSEEPWLEVSIPSVLDPSLAPEGKHVASLCAHFAPRHLRGTNWDQSRNALARAVIRVLERHAPGFASLVVGSEVLTPEDIERRWGLSGGHIFHGETSLDQTWIGRPLVGWASYRTPVTGLYLGSAGVHPGGGLTGLPGLLAAQTVEGDLRKKR